MTTLSLRTSKSASKGRSTEKHLRLVQTRLIGDAGDVSKEEFAGAILKFQSPVPLASPLQPDLTVFGTAISTTKSQKQFAINTKSTNRYRRNDPMAIDQILEEFHRLSEARSRVLKTIADDKNEIISITERVEELQSLPRNGNQELKDQLAKAKDKRKRIRQEITEHEHSVRMYESKISALKMQFRWLTDES